MIIVTSIYKHLKKQNAEKIYTKCIKSESHEF